MDDDADRLYGLPLADFVPERTALVKRLRAEGRREEAAQAAKLAKPTVAAWAANQVLRTQTSDARELFAAGDALAAADRDTLRDAITRHREALGRLMAAARGLLDPDGKSLSAQSTEKVMQTLNAASLDPALREEAQAGRLTREHSFSGLGLREPAAAPAPKKAPKKPKVDAEAQAERKRRKAAVKAAEKRLARATKAVREAEERLAAAREDEAAARAELDDLGGA